MKLIKQREVLYKALKDLLHSCVDDEGGVVTPSPKVVRKAVSTYHKMQTERNKE